VTGLLFGLAGIVLMLPFAGLAGQTPVFGTTARVLVLVGSACYGLGWLATGWAVARSGMFSVGDGAMLMVAAPLLGLVGSLIGSLQTFGAIFALIAGIGIGYRSGRLLPRDIIRDAANASLPTAAPTAGGPAGTGGSLAAG